ncbi:MAG: hypothetical protein GX800_10330 [Clostridiaceae bacterium]|nr:hypothetical protein [Clostridiaceae bacterium]
MTNKRLLPIIMILLFCLFSQAVFADNENDNFELNNNTNIEITLSVTPETIDFGNEISLTARVTAVGVDSGTGIIIFYKGDAEEISRQSFEGEKDYNAAYTPEHPGEYTFYAIFSDNNALSVHSNNVTYTVEKLTNEITLTSSNASIAEGELITFHAQLEHITHGNIVFQNGNSDLITVPLNQNGIAEYITSVLPVGAHTITAKFQGNELYKEVISDELIQTILSKNNNLSKLKLSDGKISFNKDRVFYRIEVANSVKYIKVTPTTEFDGAAISVSAKKLSQTLENGEQSGRIYLDAGETTRITIIITAQNSDTKTYTLNVYRAKNREEENRGSTIRYRFYPQQNSIVFADIAYHWANDIISNLLKDGVLSGEKVGDVYYFYPDRDITRAEFAVIVSKALQLDVAYTRYLELPFNDERTIPQWSIEYVRAVYFNGWMGGDGIGFNPNSSITRAEAMTVLARITGLYSDGVDFADSWQIPEWAYSSMAGLVNAGVVTGYDDNTIRPTNFITRAEAAKIIHATLK